jgi:hemoglobin
MPRLIDHQTKFLCHVLGGPADYTGRSLAASHRNLGITSAEFAEVAEILQETLEDFDLNHADIASVMSVVASTRSDIVSGS